MDGTNKYPIKLLQTKPTVPAASRGSTIGEGKSMYDTKEVMEQERKRMRQLCDTDIARSNRESYLLVVCNIYAFTDISK